MIFGSCHFLFYYLAESSLFRLISGFTAKRAAAGQNRRNTRKGYSGFTDHKQVLRTYRRNSKNHFSVFTDRNKQSSKSIRKSEKTFLRFTAKRVAAGQNRRNARKIFSGFTDRSKHLGQSIRKSEKTFLRFTAKRAVAGQNRRNTRKFISRITNHPRNKTKPGLLQKQTGFILPFISDRDPDHLILILMSPVSVRISHLPPFTLSGTSILPVSVFTRKTFSVRSVPSTSPVSVFT